MRNARFFAIAVAHPVLAHKRSTAAIIGGGEVSTNGTLDDLAE